MLQGNSCKPFLKCFRHSFAYWPRTMSSDQLTICSVCQRDNIVSIALNQSKQTIRFIFGKINYK